MNGIPEDARLCYVSPSGRCYFTTAPLDQQHGDDWDDMPYEHNAGPPYEWENWMKVPPYELYDVFVVGPFGMPCDGRWVGTDEGGEEFRTSWSVDLINAGATPWLTWYEESETYGMYAGDGIDNLLRACAECGGTVYWPTSGES